MSQNFKSHTHDQQRRKRFCQSAAMRTHDDRDRQRAQPHTRHEPDLSSPPRRETRGQRRRAHAHAAADATDRLYALSYRHRGVAAPTPHRESGEDRA